MAGGRTATMLHDMESRTVTISLDVRVQGDDVRGWAAAGDGHPRAFTGWLGLIGAIDALLGFPPDAGGAARALASSTPPSEGAR
jgi:hypothetical protein